MLPRRVDSLSPANSGMRKTILPAGLYAGFCLEGARNGHFAGAGIAPMPQAANPGGWDHRDPRDEAEGRQVRRQTSPMLRTSGQSSKTEHEVAPRTAPPCNSPLRCAQNDLIFHLNNLNHRVDVSRETMHRSVVAERQLPAGL